MYKVSCPDCGLERFKNRQLWLEIKRGYRSTRCNNCRLANIKSNSGSFKKGLRPWNYFHGLTKSSTYKSWEAMKRRCLVKNAHNYKWYGGRGIRVCDRWMTFKNFLDDMGIKPKEMTIGRVNNFGNYEPSNCRWETWQQQAKNTRKTAR